MRQILTGSLAIALLAGSLYAQGWSVPPGGTSSGSGLTSGSVTGNPNRIGVNCTGTPIVCNVDLTNPVILPNPSLGPAAPLTETWTVGAGGVSQYTLVQPDTSSPLKIISSTSGAHGIAVTSQASGTVEVARWGQVQCYTDTGGSTAGHLAIPGTGTANFCKDSGQTTVANIPRTTRIVGVFQTTVSGGATAIVDLTPNHYGIQIETLNQNTNGTAGGLGAAYIDWNAGSGGSSILNKPTIPAAPAVNTVASSATPTFDLSLGTVQKINALATNITGITLSNPTSGARYTFVICQDGTGGRTVTGWPAAVYGVMNFGSGGGTLASACAVQAFVYDSGAAAYFAEDAGVANAGVGSGGATAPPGVLTRRTAVLIAGADNGFTLVNADLGPQTNQAKISEAATIQEITLSVDNASSTTSIQVRKRHCSAFSGGTCSSFTVTNLLSAALPAASTALADACAMSATSQTCIDGTTSSGTITVSTTAIAAGDWIELASGTADGTTKRATLSVTYTIN